MESNVMVESSVLAEVLPGVALDEGQWLVAALAAAMVEYRRYVGQQRVVHGQEATACNWRTIARWEQLQGLA